jgi:hypothetical protein
MFNARAEGLASKSVFSRLLAAGAASSSTSQEQQHHTDKAEQHQHGVKQEEEEVEEGEGNPGSSSSQQEEAPVNAAAQDGKEELECRQQGQGAGKAAADVPSSPSGHKTKGSSQGISSPHASKGRPKRCVHRCVVLLNGFYEWKADAKGKQPYYISRGEDHLLLAAGLWDTWTGEGGTWGRGVAARGQGPADGSRSLVTATWQLPCSE